MILSTSGLNCLDVGYQAMITMMQNTTWGSPADGMRQWIYQVHDILFKRITPNTRTPPAHTNVPHLDHAFSC